MLLGIRTKILLTKIKLRRKKQKCCTWPASVTKIGETLPLWQSLLWAFLEDSFYLWQNLQPSSGALAIFSESANFHCFKWPKIQK